MKKLKTDDLARCGLDEVTAKELSVPINQYIESLAPVNCWGKVSKNILNPEQPFEFHRFLYETIYADWDSSQGPPPAWTPSEEFINTTNLARLMNELGFSSYRELHKWSVEHRGDFWGKMAEILAIRFKHPFTKVMDTSAGVNKPNWFAGAKLNIAESCFNAPDDSAAIIYGEADGTLLKLSYKELGCLTNQVANSLKAAGIKTGDAVAVIMPMRPECVAIYLGIIKAGCIVVSIADSFAPPEIKKRLILGNAKCVFTQDYVAYSGKKLPLFDKVVSAESPRAVVLASGNSVSVDIRKNDVSWDEFLSHQAEFDSITCKPGDYTNILFSSGTTGTPKAIPWTHITPVKCAADGFLHHNIQPGDVVAWPTNLGWMMGPWLIYASLINRATIGLYGDTPTTRSFGQFVQDAKVTMLGLVPSMVNIWRNNQCMQGLDWSRIKAYSSTGECSNAEDMLFLMSLAGYKPVIEYCGGTEIGGGYITGTVVQPACPATFTTPALGLDFVILDEKGLPADNGEVFLIPPSIGLSTELLNVDHSEVYFEGTPKGPHGEKLRRHGDQIERLPGGYFRCLGRTDDTMNLGGIKVSSAEIERSLSSINDIYETAAVAVLPEDKGPSKLVIYVVLSSEINVEKEAVKKTMQDVIKRELNPLFRIHDVVYVDSLPRTASNKVMRRELRGMYEKSSIILKKR